MIIDCHCHAGKGDWLRLIMIVDGMAKLDGLETILEFIKGLQPKIAAQIAKKVMSFIEMLYYVQHDISDTFQTTFNG